MEDAFTQTLNIFFFYLVTYRIFLLYGDMHISRPLTLRLEKNVYVT